MRGRRESLAGRHDGLVCTSRTEGEIEKECPPAVARKKSSKAARAAALRLVLKVELGKREWESSTASSIASSPNGIMPTCPGKLLLCSNSCTCWFFTFRALGNIRWCVSSLMVQVF